MKHGRDDAVNEVIGMYRSGAEDHQQDGAREPTRHLSSAQDKQNQHKDITRAKGVRKLIAEHLDLRTCDPECNVPAAWNSGRSV